MHHSDEHAVCRGCGLVLIGKPYHMGGSAFHATTRERAKANHFGGFVCSETCDRRAHLEQEASMPGHAGQSRLSYQDSEKISRKWKEPAP